MHTKKNRFSRKRVINSKKKRGGATNRSVSNKILKVKPPVCKQRNENSCYLVTNCKWDKNKSECHDIDDLGDVTCNNLSWYSCIKPCKWDGNINNGVCSSFDDMTKPIKPNKPSKKESLLDTRDTLTTELQRLKKEDDNLSKRKVSGEISKKRLKLREKHRNAELEIEKINHEIERLQDISNLRTLMK